jgi:hypothetical protein
MATRSSNEVTRLARATTRSGRGKAPPIAALNAEAARLNIVSKLEIVRDHLARAANGVQPAVNSAVCLTVAHLPRSPRQFNMWESASLPQDVRSLVPTFVRNSNATLKKHEKLHIQVVEQVGAVDKHFENPKPKEATRAALLRQLSQANRLRAIAEKELIRARRELADERSKMDALEGEVSGTAVKAKEEAKELKSQLATLSSENARLTSIVKKTTGLTAV